MRRRDFLVLLVGGTMMWPPRINAQQSQKMPRIGVLLPGTPASFSLRIAAFLDELGHVEGKTIAIEWRWGQDRIELLPGLAAELVRSNVDVIVTAGTSAAKTVKAATRSIPIVMAIVSDPVAAGVVDRRECDRFQHRCAGIGRKASRAAKRDRARDVVGRGAVEQQESGIAS
jgi:ABC-type uncharacterized transport system substrate-binding protein